MKFEIRSVKKKYGKKEPLTDASLSAKEGQCIGILGKNGIGKSTFLKTICGIDGDIRLVICIGYAKEGDKLRSKKRKDLEKLISFKSEV